MPKIDTTAEANIRYYVGSTGAGKSYQVKVEVKNKPRLLIFDVDSEYAEIPNIRTFETCLGFVEAVIAAGDGPLKARLCAEGRDAFEVFCATAFGWGDCCVVAEELADVTTPAKAPPQWGRLLRRGRKRLIEIYGTTQRPAEADKTILGQASTLRTGRLKNAADRKAMAANMDIEQRFIDRLKPLDFIVSDDNLGIVAYGHKGEKHGELKTLAQLAGAKNETATTKNQGDDTLTA